MEPKKLNDLKTNLKPKVIRLRFTGEKFPTDLWKSSCQIKK